MRFDQTDGLRGIAEDKVPAPSAVRRFVEAVLALSDSRGQRNVERYLVPSRALEDSRSRTTPRPRRAA